MAPLTRGQLRENQRANLQASPPITNTAPPANAGPVQSHVPTQAASRDSEENTSEGSPSEGGNDPAVIDDDSEGGHPDEGTIEHDGLESREGRDAYESDEENGIGEWSGEERYDDGGDGEAKKGADDNKTGNRKAKKADDVVESDSWKWAYGFDHSYNGVPINTLQEMFDHMTYKVLFESTGEYRFRHEHCFSAEIEPFKQRYIARNWPDVSIFRDVTKFVLVDHHYQGTTVYGSQAEVPAELDILVAGKSGHVFSCILLYITQSRPKVVLFENVIATDAIWRTIEEDIEKERYMAKILKLDIKDFYLPQTRNRRYMLCVDLDLFKEKDEARKLLETWEAYVKCFKQTTAVSAETMLLLSAEETPEAFSQFGDPEIEKRTKRDDWEDCKIKMRRFRDNLALGTGRSLTLWNESGFRAIPDFWTQKNPPLNRILDVLEISHLRGIKRGYDDRYYSQSLDVSQNIHRDRGTDKNGIFGCITPAGKPWLTVFGRQLTGRETLILQGLPPNRMDLSYLKDKQIQNLAGNAMSSTVIGATMISALLALASCKDYNFRNLVLDRFEFRTAVLSTNEAIAQARSTRRLCGCEGPHRTAHETFWECRICSHTSCQKHPKNPKHDYRPPSLKAYQNPADFEKTLNQVLLIDETKIDQLLKVTEIGDEALLGHISQALSSHTFMTSIERMDIWRVTYESDYAKAVIQISENEVEWLLYAKAATNWSFDDPRRVQFEQFPIARMKPELGQAITAGMLELWVPSKREIHLTLKSDVGLVESFESLRGIPDFLDTKVSVGFSLAFQTQDEEDKFDVTGYYKLHQECGQAFNSLHARVQTGGQPQFIFYDHQRQMGDPRGHCYILTQDPRRLRFGEYRRNIGRFSCRPAFDQIRFKEIADSESKRYSKLDYEGTILDESPLEEPVVEIPVVLYVDGTWSKVATDDIMSIDPVGNSSGEFITYQHLSMPPLAPSVEFLGCSNTWTIFDCNAKIAEKFANRYEKSVRVTINQKNALRFYTDFRYLFARCLVMKPHIWGLETWQQVSQDEVKKRCLECSPEHPKLFRILASSKGESRVAVSEDTAQAGEYERKMKLRPPPFSQTYCIEEEQLNFRIHLNPLTVVHQAVDELTTDGNRDNIKAEWRLVTDDKSMPRDILGRFKECESEEAANWALSQETYPEPFTEEEIVEAECAEFGYRVWGRATRKVTRRVGILAADVGFGKTPTILALIQHAQVRSEELHGYIPTKATLIFVPRHIVQQWKTEIETFTPSMKICTILTAQGFAKYTVQDFRNADIILMPRTLCDDAPYLKALARVSGQAELESKPPARIQSQWYETACEKIKGHVSGLSESNKLKQEIVLEMFSFARVIIDEFQQIKPDTGQTLRQVKSHAKWLLSATPPRNGFADVKLMADLIGIKLGVDDISSIPAEDWTRATKNLTEYEKLIIHRSIPSLPWKKRRHDIAQNFLNQYFRKDASSVHIGKIDNIKLVFQPPAERLSYLDLEHGIAAPDLPENSTSSRTAAYSKRPDKISEYDEQLNSGHRGTTDATLLWRAAHYSPCQRSKSQSTNDIILDLLMWLKDQDESMPSRGRFAEFQQRLQSSAVTFGDAGIQDKITPLVLAAAENVTEDDWNLFFTKDVEVQDPYRNKAATEAKDKEKIKLEDSFEPYPSGMVKHYGKFMHRMEKPFRLAVGNLVSLVEEAVKRQRSLRFTQAIFDSYTVKQVPCAKCLKTITSPEERIILIETHEKIGDSKLKVDQEVTSLAKSASIPGEKINQLMAKLKSIKDMDEKVLLFFNDDGTRTTFNTLKSAMDLEYLQYATLVDARAKPLNNFDTVLADFQTGKDVKCKTTANKATVLLIDIEDDSAAGSNLTAAKWVIFFSPYLTIGTDAHDRYHATMRQAIGRVRRFDPKDKIETAKNGDQLVCDREVHVLHFLTAYTMDIDLYEERTRKQVALPVDDDTTAAEPEARGNAEGSEKTAADGIEAGSEDIYNDDDDSDVGDDGRDGLDTSLQRPTEVDEGSQQSTDSDESVNTRDSDENVDLEKPFHPGPYASTIAHLVLGRNGNV
ncbi:uncharacterized protein LY89DRAFT_778739 [Mollisia scopiformis]|uniref:Helicase ATP-binding domain-containing protein n=1 Tax=Mollisia scopiformis TaxID=149040 RepID=A0A194XLV9_MOLSC|nr:uncharacterized protein LY89DRAFT_778739 [Mollisia scopiformis]KUJ21121.1 hypothetical protein LY89DRAFT_778739 [Mollisia scopiformis]